MEQLLRLLIPVLSVTVCVVMILSTTREMSAQTEGVSTAAASGQSGSKEAVRIDINTATPDQLKTLTGIGDTYAKRIVEGRPYRSTEELAEKGLLPQTTYDKIKNQIVAMPK